MTQQKMLTEIYTSLKPLLIISHLTGVFIFRIDTKSSKIVTSIWNKIAVLTFYMIYIIGIYPYSKSNLISQMFFTKTSKASSFALIYIDHLVTVSSTVWIFFKRENFFEILVKLSEIDEILIDFGVKIDHKKEQRKINFLMISTMIVQLCLTVFTIVDKIFNDTRLDLFPIFYSLMIFINAVALVSHFGVLMFNIGIRFKMMSLCIKQSPQNCQKMHLKIVECVKIFNSIYGFPMMIFFANLFLWCCILASLILYVENSDIRMILGTYVSLIMAVLALFMIMYIAEMTLNAKTELVQLLYDKMSNEPENLMTILPFILQIRHVNVGFSCKFIDFNWHFVFKFITACVMYLTIIIQLEKSMDKV
ncbi:hypothetical protein ACKWTF_016173 [Chironomus riparius]